MNSLKSAKKKRPPHYEFINRNTLLWIKKNRPCFNCELHSRGKDVDLNILKQFIIPNKWFINMNRINTLHGKRHIIRTALYSLIISSICKCGKTKRRNITISSLLHDLRRLSDGEDSDHGRRGSRWFLKNMSMIESFFKTKLSKKDQNEIYYSILWHNVPRASIVNNKNYLKYKKAIEVLRTADALDRYCQPKIEWRINDNYLIYIPDINLKKFAYELIIRSEQRFLNGLNNEDAVLGCLEKYHGA